MSAIGFSSARPSANYPFSMHGWQRPKLTAEVKAIEAVINSPEVDLPDGAISDACRGLSNFGRDYVSSRFGVTGRIAGLDKGEVAILVRREEQKLSFLVFKRGNVLKKTIRDALAHVKGKLASDFLDEGPDH